LHLIHDPQPRKPNESESQREQAPESKAQNTAREGKGKGADMTAILN